MSDNGEQPVRLERAADSPAGRPWRWIDPLLRRLADLGLSASIFDVQGQQVHLGPPAGPFTRLIRQTDVVRATDAARVVVDLVQGSQPSAMVTAAPGCHCLLTPIQRRRRRVGVLSAICVCRDMPDGEELARFCQMLQLDREMLLRLARQEARFDENQLSSVRSIVATMLEQAVEQHASNLEIGELSQNLTNTYEELSLIYKVAAGMTVTEKADDYLRSMGAELLEVLAVESLAMRYFRPDQPLISEHIGIGLELTAASVEQSMWDELLRRFELRPEEIVSNLPVGDSGRLRSLVHHQRVRQLAAVPMTRNGRLIGALVAMNKASGDFDSTDLKLMKSIADEAAVFLENSYLYEDLQQLLMGMLRALTSSIDAKDPYTCGHSERVARIASRIAQAAGLDDRSVHRVYLTGLLHDVGKIGVPEAVLTKPGRLTKPEFDIMRKHPEIGARILGDIKQVQDLVPGVLHHHERMDGRGYPRGLAGEAIPLFGRIVGLADCFDAMTSNRTYRRALPLEVTLTEIRRFAGTQFDPRMVEAFMTLDAADLIRQTRAIDPMDPLNRAQAATRSQWPDVDVAAPATGLLPSGANE